MSLTWSATFVKYLLFGFNFILVITGVILLSVGLTVQGAFHGYSDILDGGFYSIPSFLIAIGAIIFFIAFFGCCGAIKENYWMTLIFSILLVLVFILELSAGISGYVLRNQTINLVDDALTTSMKQYQNGSAEIQMIWDEIQLDFQCCGVRGPDDWLTVLNETESLPTSCCKRQTGSIGSFACTITNTNILFDKGCLDVFGNFVKDHAVTLGTAAMVLAFVQFVGIFFACFLTKQIRDQRWLQG